MITEPAKFLAERHRVVRRNDKARDAVVHDLRHAGQVGADNRCADAILLGSTCPKNSGTGVFPFSRDNVDAWEHDAWSTLICVYKRPMVAVVWQADRMAVRAPL